MWNVENKRKDKNIVDIHRQETEAALLLLDQVEPNARDRSLLYCYRD